MILVCEHDLFHYVWQDCMRMKNVSINMEKSQGWLCQILQTQICCLHFYIYIYTDPTCTIQPPPEKSSLFHLPEEAEVITKPHPWYSKVSLFFLFCASKEPLFPRALSWSIYVEHRLDRFKCGANENSINKKVLQRHLSPGNFGGYRIQSKFKEGRRLIYPTNYHFLPKGSSHKSFPF